MAINGTLRLPSIPSIQPIVHPFSPSDLIGVWDHRPQVGPCVISLGASKCAVFRLFFLLPLLLLRIFAEPYKPNFATIENVRGWKSWSAMVDPPIFVHQKILETRFRKNRVLKRTLLQDPQRSSSEGVGQGARCWASSRGPKSRKNRFFQNITKSHETL